MSEFSIIPPDFVPRSSVQAVGPTDVADPEVFQAFYKVYPDLHELAGSNWQRFGIKLFRVRPDSPIFLGIVIGEQDYDAGKWKDIQHPLIALLREGYVGSPPPVRFLISDKQSRPSTPDSRSSSRVSKRKSSDGLVRVPTNTSWRKLREKRTRTPSTESISSRASDQALKMTRLGSRRNSVGRADP